MAVVVDFEDLTVGVQYDVGSTFVSREIEFEVLDFGESSGGVRIGQSTSPLSTVVLIDNGNMLGVNLPTNVSYASLDFNNACRGCNGLVAVINGVTLPPIVFSNSFDGFHIPGLQLTLQGVANQSGTLIIEGPLISLGLALSSSSVSYGGRIDNLTLLTVPEPEAWILASGCVVLLMVFSFRIVH